MILVCNSHIDPVWLWPWEEGLAATLGTFRAAADLCDEFDSFVFCHNEALLYAWVEEYEPALFARIRRLVREGRWHVMGGWYLQPDCNLPCGESLVRQILVGKRYFAEKFGVEPAVAVNLDPFGHTRGLVQILAKSGYTGYLFCRPDAQWLPLPGNDFRWEGHDGSTVIAHRAVEHYNSERGRARAKIERWLNAGPGDDRGLLLWGVGNHGGGPSREDLRAIDDLQRDFGRRVVHGRPEDYFAQLQAAGDLPRHAGDLNPWAVGCYTSMARLKQAYLRLERGLFSAEAMLANAVVQRLLVYPRAELRAALEDLLFCQFHDILPGEGVRAVEQQALDRLGHGLEIVGRLRARAFFAHLSGQPPAAEGEYPIFVHNHHPFALRTIIECEFQPPEPNPNRAVFWHVEMTTAAGEDVPLQLEKESCNIQADQRKRVVFRARLPASQTARFNGRLVERPAPRLAATAAAERPAQGLGRTLFTSDRAEFEIDFSTGLLSAYRVDGVDYLAGPAFRPLVMHDTADPWGMKTRAFRDLAGEFALLPPAAAAAFAGVDTRELPAVRVIESGRVRTVVEALFGFGRSGLCLRYKLPSTGSELEIEATVSWFEADRLLKLSLPTPFAGGSVRKQTAYGVDVVEREAEEQVAHRWIAAVAPDGSRALTVVSEATYGFDAVVAARRRGARSHPARRAGPATSAGCELRLSLLRAPAYAGHPVDDLTPIVRQDRFEAREDQGLHTFRFWLNGGRATERLDAIGREAAARTDPPMALNAYPPGGGPVAAPGLVLDDDVVQTGCLKLAEDGDQLVARLFEPTGRARTTTLRIPSLAIEYPLTLGAFEIRTLLIDPVAGTVHETDLLERGTRKP